MHHLCPRRRREQISRRRYEPTRESESVARIERTRTAGDAARACGCAMDQLVRSLVIRGAGTLHHEFEVVPAQLAAAAEATVAEFAA